MTHLPYDPNHYRFQRSLPRYIVLVRTKDSFKYKLLSTIGGIVARFKKGLDRGTGHTSSRLTTQQIIEIFQSPEKPAYLAAVYKVSVITIYNIKNRHTHYHITNLLPSTSKRTK